MTDKHIIIFKNITDGFMNLEKINNLADIFELNPTLKDKIIFILDNNNSNESNQALMQMYNSLIGFDVFKASLKQKSLLEYKHLNNLQLRKKMIPKEIDLDKYIKEKYNNCNIKKYNITDDIYKNILLMKAY